MQDLTVFAIENDSTSIAHDSYFITNISQQTIALHIEKANNNPIYQKSGHIRLTPGQELLVEVYRVSYSRLIHLSQAKMISLQKTRQNIEVPAQPHNKNGNVMVATANYRGIQIVQPNPTGNAGQMIQNNFKTLADMIANVGGLGQGSTNYKSPTVTNDSTTNGTNLLNAYDNAKTLTPNGASLSATNRACIILLPGTYNVPTSLTLDTEFIDIVGIGSRDDIIRDQRRQQRNHNPVSR